MIFEFSYISVQAEPKDNDWSSLHFSSAFVVFTVDEIKNHTKTTVIDVFDPARSTDFFRELIRDVIPMLPNFRVLNVIEANVTREVHALCAELIGACPTCKIIKIPKPLDYPQIETFYIRALRKTPCLDRRMIIDFDAPLDANVFPRFQELANISPPTMLEYCHEALCRRLEEDRAEN